MKTTHLARLTSAAAAIALLLTACGVPTPSPAGGDSGSSAVKQVPGTSGATLPKTDPALDKFTSQKVDWTPCESSKECATFTVPVDYAHPDGETTSIKAIRIKSAKKDAPDLFVNPGGPGGSGYDMIKDDEDRFANKKIMSQYNVIGFDPRGVGKSDPIRCLTDSEIDAMRAVNYDVSGPGGLEKRHAEAKKVAESCSKNSGPVLEHMDTASVARDLDVMRAALGNAKLNFFGYSYGTTIGAMYATLFGPNVGRFVLDGAVAPNISDKDTNLGQAEGFETAFSEFIKYCGDATDCGLDPDPAAGKKQLAEMQAKLRAKPAKTLDGRLFTAEDFNSALLLPLYSRDSWKYLGDALGEFKKGDVDSMMRLADLSMERGDDGKYTSNSNFAFSAVQCLDQPLQDTDAEITAAADELKAKAPFVGPMIAYSQVSCVEWPVKPAQGAPKIEIKDSLEVLVVGTTRDPATPYDWAKKLKDAFGDKASLLTREGDGHTAFGGGNTCIDDAVISYLTTGQKPTGGKVCA